MSAREELIEIITRDGQSSGGDRTWAEDLVDALLHEEAEELRKRSEELRRFRSYEMTQQAEGLLLGADLIDPYAKQDNPCAEVSTRMLPRDN